MGNRIRAVLLGLILACVQAPLDAGVVTVEAGPLRVQVLSPSLVRLERRGPQGFEDRPTFHVVARDWPGATVLRRDTGQGLELLCASWSLTVPPGARELADLVLRDGRGGVHRPGAGPLTSTRFLPSPGERPQVWAVADTPRMVPPPWGATPAPGPTALPATSGWDLGNDAPDLYVFLPRGDYGRLRSDLLRLTGPTELPPLYLFGGFHSRFYPYTDQGALAVIREYRERRIPLDVFMLDTDWRVSASFGYDENLKLFPDMPGFLAQAHGLGVRVGCNDHPKPLAPQALDPRELAYRYHNLARWLKAGVDFWWFDRNWEVSLEEPLPGLCKEVWGMQLFRDMTRRILPDRRPLIMANADGVDNGHLNRPADIASHRFPFQWTGDTWLGWTYLRWGVENAVRSGVQSLIPYLSEDLGSHQGLPSPEYYLRHYQYGVLSAVVRPHCSNSAAFRREPWCLGPEVEDAARELLAMRYRLLPHLYGAARRNFETGEPLLARLDLSHPGRPEAARDDQYLLGDGLLVAPVLTGEPPNRPVPGAWLRTPEGRPGIRLELFPNENLLGSPVHSRVEPAVDAHWVDEPPGPGLPPAYFSTRWTGRVTPDRPVQLGLRMEEGGRLWVDGQLVVDAWVPGTWNLGLDPVTTVPGRAYDVQVESRHGDGEARCQLFYRPMTLPDPPVARQVWLPDGEWLDAWTGARVQGPRTLEVRAGAKVIPMWIRAGSLFPLAPDMQHTGEKPWDPITLDCYPSPARVARAELYEDDRVSNAYREGACRRTVLEAHQDQARRTVTVRIGAATGGFDGARPARAWGLRVHAPPGLGPVREVKVDGRPVTGWRCLPRGPAATPFQNRGPALDGEVLAVDLPAGAVGSGRAIEIRYGDLPGAARCSRSGFLPASTLGGRSTGRFLSKGSTHRTPGPEAQTPSSGPSSSARTRSLHAGQMPWLNLAWVRSPMYCSTCSQYCRSSRIFLQ